MVKHVVTICATLFVLAGSVRADVTTYTSQADWAAALTTPVSTINWDDVTVPDSTYTTISGDHYAGMPGSPVLSIPAGTPQLSGLNVINPGPDGPAALGSHFFPVSGENVFADTPPSPEGTLTISFGTPVYALGAWFLDVESDHAGTGIEVDGTLYAFSTSQGDKSQSFLGIVSTTPFTTANICMAVGPTRINGVGIDDTMYAVVPIPGAALLSLLGLSAAGLRLRKRA